MSREKGRDLTQSYDKAPTPTEKFEKQRDNINNATKTSIKQRTDLGWSVGVTAVTPLVWLTGALNLPTKCNSREIKRHTFINL